MKCLGFQDAKMGFMGMAGVIRHPFIFMGSGAD